MAPLIAAIFAVLFASPVWACKCGERAPLCSRFPTANSPIFVGRVVEVHPRPWSEFEARLAAIAGFDDVEAMHDQGVDSLDSETARRVVLAWQDYWRGAISADADRALEKVKDLDGVERWTDEFADEHPFTVRLETIEIFAGDVGPMFQLRSGASVPGSCSGNFQVGQEYLVFAFRVGEGWATNSCAGTSLARVAGKELEYLRGYASAPETARIFGTFHRHVRDVATGRYSMERISGANVTIRSGDQDWRVRTDSMGRFELDGLSAGNYTVTSQYRDWAVVESQFYRARTLPQGPLTRVLRPRGCTQVNLTAYQERGRIHGRLIDHLGKPLIGKAVELVSADPPSRQQETTKTGQEGRFVFEWLEPGAYLLGVNIHGAPSMRFAHEPPHPTTYYPGTSVREGAIRVAVRRGEPTDLADLHVPPRLNERRIKGKALRADGGSVEGSTITLQQEGFLLDVDYKKVDATGAFEMVGFAGLDYKIRASLWDGEWDREWTGESPAVAGGQGEAVVVLRLRIEE